MKSLIGGILNKAPVPYVSRSNTLPNWFGGSGTMESRMETMATLGTVFSIVHRTSSATSQVDWCMYRTHDGRGRITGGEDRREVTNHLAVDVLNKPNQFMTRQALFEVTQQHIDLVGEGYWVIVRSPILDLPIELWPVRPDQMTPVEHPTEFLSGWVYTGPNGEKVPLDVRDVIQFKMPNPLDLYRGMGPVQSVMADIDGARYSAEWNRNFFLNSAEPGGIIEFPERIQDDDYRKFMDRWREQHQGVAQAHRVALLESGMVWKDRSVSQRDMQFVELRNISRDVIREAFGMSKTMLGQTEDVNRATAEAAEYVFAKYALTERLERFKGGLNEQFLPLFGPAGQGVEFDYEDPVPENADAENAERDSKVSALATLVGAGFDPDDALEALGLPPMAYIGTPSASTPAPTDQPALPAPAPAPASAPAELPPGGMEPAMTEPVADRLNGSNGHRPMALQ